MQNYNEPELLSEEIDLSNAVKNVKAFLKKWQKTFFYFSIIGILSGVAYYLVSPKEYKSRMFIHTTLLKGPNFIMLLDDLQRHLKEKNFEEVSKLLQMDSLDVVKIDRIHVNTVTSFTEKQFNDFITTEEIAKDEEVNTDEFVIEVFVQDIKVLQPLEKGLINYLNNNEYIKQKSAIRKQTLKLIKDKVHSELINLDNLKNSINNLYTGTNKISSSLSMNDPSAIYNNIISLYQTELNTEIQINNPDISVIQGFIPYKKPDSPKLQPSVLSGLMVSLLMAVLYILYVELRNILRNNINN